MIEERLLELAPARRSSRRRRELGLDGDLPEPELLPPEQKEHGDFATNVALALASRAGAPAARGGRGDRATALPPAPFVEQGRGRRPGFLNIFDDRRLAARRAAPDRGRGRALTAARRADGRARSRWSSSARTRPGRCTSATRATPPWATRWRACSRPRAGTVEREYYFNDAGGQMDRFGASVEARYLQLLGRDAELPEDGYHGDYVADIAARHPATSTGRRARRPAPTSERFARLLRRGRRADRWTAIKGTLERFGVPVRRVLLRGRARAQGRDRRRDRAAPRRRVRRTRPTARCGSARTDFGDDKDRVLVRSQRRAHVLRGRLRVPGRQVRARVRPPDLRVGRRPSRRRRAGEGRRAGAGLRPGRGRDRALPVRRRSCAAASR